MRPHAHPRWLALALPALLCACGSGEVRSASDASPEAADLQLTTTVAAETGNDTAASDLFVDKYQPATRFNGSSTPISNGDAPASPLHRADMLRGAVSKVNVHTLLSSGAATKIFVETQTWFCSSGQSPLPTGAPADQCGSHIDIGYETNASAHVAAQLDDMQSRGFDGLIADWEGSGAGHGVVDAHSTSTAAINNGWLFAMLAESERRGGSFKIAIMEDEGIRACAAQSGCDVTAALLTDLNFLHDQGVYASSAYYKDASGRPFVFFFDIDGQVAAHGKSIDWTRVRSGAKGNPVFIFQGGGQFGHAQGGGAFFWAPAPSISSYQDGDPEQLKDLAWFYQQALGSSGKHAFGGLFKGFDDKVVNGWGGGERYIPQLCGKTWLDGFAQVNARYSAAHPLEALQVMTWDDYEEGTEIESGIDNHLEVKSAAVQGNTLSWSVGLASDAPSECASAVSGGWSVESTVNHFVIYASPANDGQNLALVADDVPAGTHSLDLTNKLPPGDYVLFVKAVGQPSIRNHLSSGVSYRVQSPVSGSVTITSPAAGAVVGTHVHVVASATSNVAISQLQIWDNGQKYFVQQGAALDTTVTLPAGSHKLTVVALDTSYAQITKATVSYTVSTTDASCSGTPFFCDDFTNAALGSAYAPRAGTWNRSSGSYTVSDGTAWQRASSTLSNDFSDFDVTVRGTGLGDSGLGLAYNLAASSSSYDAVIVHPAQFQGVYLKKIVPGSSDTDLASYPLPASLQGQELTLRVKRVGTQVTVWLNGQQVLQSSDGASGSHGQLGLLESTTDDVTSAGAQFTLLRVEQAPAGSTGPCSGSPYFCDDYSGSTLASGYTAQSGSWTRATGSYTAEQPTAWARAASTLAGNFGDFDVTVKGTGLGDSGLGLAYNFSAMSAAYDAVVVHPAQFQGVFLKKVNPGASDTDLGHDALPASMQGQALSLRVKRVGTQVTVWLNGQQVLQADDGAPGATGQLGLLESTTNVTSGAGARFTLLRVESGPASAPPPPSNVVGPRGGSVDLLQFSMTGDTRPGSSNSTGVTDYPSAVIDQIADQAKANGSQFMIDMGDHMNNWHNQTTASEQLDKYKAAMARFGNTWFMTMGNHECDPSVMSWPLRCVPNGTNGTTGNFLAYLGALSSTGVDVVHNGETVPWYSFDVQTSKGLARFIIVADNAWCPAQQTWLENELSDADAHAKYTIVVQHHPPYDGSDAKADVQAISDLLTQGGHHVSLWLTGHAHGYKRRTDILGGRAVVLGTGGAPLDKAAGTSSNGWNYFYGYGMVKQQSNGDLAVTIYDLNNLPMDSWTVSP